ncbi:hypothetical protein GCM10010971_41530 [Silvimonas amylolytica]|uniref:DUF4124 domain-containing protein n=1 Tax=Silvimonas amylolytica TaxID=449663 RepID=A0ABQ2PTT5_9NEIS|nr:hypothetical protein GCM10010971_02440 [Silvimonas amylolytica]GGP28334.1 hypothetical protein GCM10010971_41530 [Silvimonas amylolytica]
MRLAIFMFLLVDLIIYGVLDHWGPFHFPMGSDRVATIALPWQRDQPEAPIRGVRYGLPRSTDLAADEVKIRPSAELQPKASDPALTAASGAPHTTIYKCRSDSGGVLFQDTPCSKK